MNPDWYMTGDYALKKDSSLHLQKVVVASECH